MRFKAQPKRVVFAEGEEDSVIRAAAAFQNSGLGKAILVGRADIVKAGMKPRRASTNTCWKSSVPHSAEEAASYIDALYKRIQRRGASASRRRAHGDQRPQHLCRLDAEGGRCRRHGDRRDRAITAKALTDVRTVLDPPPGQRPIGMQVVFAKGRVVLIADTAVTEMPTARSAGRHRHPGARPPRKPLSA